MKSNNDYKQLLYDFIVMHNEHVGSMNKLADVLLETYPDVDNTPVTKAFSTAYNGVILNAISLCCEMNSCDDGKWMTNENWCIVKETVEG